MSLILHSNLVSFHTTSGTIFSVFRNLSMSKKWICDQGDNGTSEPL